MIAKKHSFLTFSWRIIAIHTISYFIAGIFALLFMDYRVLFGSELFSLLMRPFDSPWIAAGAGLQVFRGIIIALVIYPFRTIFLSGKKGWLKLWLLILGLSAFSTIGPTPGSFEGLIYTIFPIQYHFLVLPETLLYTFLFSFSICYWYKNPKKIWNILSIVLTIAIILMSVAGVLSSYGFF
jgi:hypothetical protein